MELWRLRAMAEKTLGDHFDLRGFHDAVLGGGAVTLAVLEARCGLALGGRDVFLNVAGGLKIAEPAADLAVAAALLSSVAGRAIPRDTVVFGEIGLSGELRPVAQTAARLKEAAKLGFSAAMLPAVPARAGRGGATRTRSGETPPDGIVTRAVGHLQDLVAALGADAASAGRRPHRGEETHGNLAGQPG
jgi:DNA repair protein RadA/Sms